MSKNLDIFGLCSETPATRARFHFRHLFAIESRTRRSDGYKMVAVWPPVADFLNITEKIDGRSAIHSRKRGRVFTKSKDSRNEKALKSATGGAAVTARLQFRGAVC